MQRLEHKPTINSDEELIKCVAEGDHRAFRLLVERNQSAVFRLAFAITGVRENAEDVMQETFLSAYRAAKGFSEKSSVQTWLLTIARHAAFNILRKRKHHEETRADVEDLAVHAGWGTPSPEELFLLEWQKETLKQALASLFAEEREILVLRELEELSGEETARILGLSLAGMKSRLHRARLKLAAAVKTRQNQRMVCGVSCSQVLNVLSEYLDRELDAEMTEKVRGHLNRCRVCESFGSEFGKLLFDVRRKLSAPEPLESEVETRLWNKLSGSDE